MIPQDLLELLKQLKGGASQGPETLPKRLQGGGVTRGGLSPQEEYIRWAWGPGTGASGGLGPLPLSVQGIGQQTGRSFGPGADKTGLTPEFAQKVNQLLFPNVNPQLYGQGGYGTSEAPGGFGSDTPGYGAAYRGGANTEQTRQQSGLPMQQPDNPLTPEQELIMDQASQERRFQQIYGDTNYVPKYGNDALQWYLRTIGR